MLGRGTGTIVTVSSLAAVNPNLLGGAGYGAAKAGVRNFMTFSASETAGTKPSTCGTRCSAPATSSTSSRADAPRRRPPPASWPHCAAP